jgi:hypothetical protein
MRPARDWAPDPEGAPRLPLYSPIIFRPTPSRAVESRACHRPQEVTMPKNHARKNLLAEIKQFYRVKHHEAIALLDHPDNDERNLMLHFISEYDDVDTYQQARALLEIVKDDPTYKLMCATCGWALAMICPECTGCGCDTSCSGWRHNEYAGDDDEDDPEDDRWLECECGSYERDEPCEC